MRTIRNTGGYSGYVVGRLVDSQNADLQGVPLKAVLVPDGAELPVSGSSDWVAVDVLSAGPGGARFRLLVQGKTPGRYHLWVRVADGSVVEPVRARDDFVEVV